MSADFILEVCVFNFSSCVIAEKAGAHRIELCENHHEGGITPSYGTIRMAREKVNIPIFPIIRPRAGDFCYSETEVDVIKADIALCKELKCNGISVGVLKPNSTVDVDLLKKIVEWAYPLEVTFHRAFDFTPDPMAAMEQIIDAGCKRILTSGQEVVAPDGLDTLAKLVKAANNRICIMPGAGVRASNLERVIRKTQAKEYHSSARQKIKSEIQHRRSELLYLGHTYLTDADEVKALLQVGNKTFKTLPKA